MLMRGHCTGNAHTWTSTAIGAAGRIGESEWMNTYDNVELRSMRICRTMRRTSIPRTAAWRRTVACTFDAFVARRACAWRRARSLRAAAWRRTAARHSRSFLSFALSNSLIRSSCVNISAKMQEVSLAAGDTWWSRSGHGGDVKRRCRSSLKRRHAGVPSACWTCRNQTRASSSKLRETSHTFSSSMMRSRRK